jgi:biotin/methionine sulfoxide reductase
MLRWHRSLREMDPGPVSRAHKIAEREPIRISPPDAARRGIRDGDVVRVFNARDACLAGAAIDAGVMPGVVVMATGAWFDPPEEVGAPERHGNPNVLTLDIGTSPLAQGTSALTAAVEIERRNAPPPVRAFTPPRPAAAGGDRGCTHRAGSPSADGTGGAKVGAAQVGAGQVGTA